MVGKKADTMAEKRAAMTVETMVGMMVGRMGD